jgi:Ca2+-binding RTX toxin-like protein
MRDGRGPGGAGTDTGLIRHLERRRGGQPDRGCDKPRRISLQRCPHRQHGANLLIGGAGNDTLTGGAGTDTFRFTKGDGLGRITDFSASGGEIIQLLNYGISSFTQLHGMISQQGANALINIDASNQITLTGVTATQLTAANFHFNVGTSGGSLLPGSARTGPRGRSGGPARPWVTAPSTILQARRSAGL